MKNSSTSQLQRKDREVLYHIYRQKFMAEAHLFSLGYLLSKYKEKFDKLDIERIIENLVSLGYLIKRGDAYGIPNIKKLKEIKRLFWMRRALDWCGHVLLQTWQFLWKHFIVTIIVSIITAYLMTRLLN